MNGSKPSELVGAPATVEAQPQTKSKLESRLATFPFRSIAAGYTRFLDGLVELLKIPAPETRQVLHRILLMEREIVLPIKAAGIVMLLQFFYFSSWIFDTSSALEVPVEYSRSFFWFYISVNILMAWVLLANRRLKPNVIEWSVFAMCLIDGIFLGVLTLATGGYNSVLYWLFLGLIVRTAVSVPRGATQLMLNLTLTTCYLLAGTIDTLIYKTLDATDRAILELEAANYPAEPLLLRFSLLLLMTFGCYVVQVLLDRQRLAAEEAREFAVREVQLRMAGRLAAEFAHQIKNPLAIINNAAFSLQRSLKQGRAATAAQIEMIQEEVERADRIITQVMGYAQLSEGHVERLSVLEELEHAIERVFPPAADYPITVHRNYATNFPPLLMQRRHATETFMNVMQNAREALETKGGKVFIAARCLDDFSIEVSIRDDGPGIPRDKMVKIFEAYYTTKEKGSGLGLATVKHNVELYGGTIRVQSELGKGAEFILIFPAKMLMKLAKTT